MKALIIDSGMRNLGGHNFSYTSAVRADLLAKGWSVDVLVNRGFPADLATAKGLIPFFSVGTYDYPLAHGRIRDLVYLYAQAAIRREELEHALRCVLATEYDLVFCHTVSEFELLGWSRYLSRERLGGCLALVLRNTPRFRSRSRLWQTLNPYWRLRPKALAALRRRLGGRFVLCTDSEALSEDYARVYGGRVVTLPIPLDRALFVPPDVGPHTVVARYHLADGDAIRVGYVGDARPAKGFPLLPGLVQAVLASPQAARVRFIIQCPPSAGGDDSGRAPEGLPELQALGSDPRVTLVPEKLSRTDYAALLAYIDLVLLPYTDPTYGEATSGIFAEALGLGKPVVVPSASWMARELARSGGGVEFRRDAPGELAPRVLEAIGQHAALTERARRFAPTWRQFHSAETLGSMLVAEADRVSRLR